MVRRGDVLIILLHGGDKSSQARDIEKAKAIARSL
jgi:putative addiction module killer protein